MATNRLLLIMAALALSPALALAQPSPGGPGSYPGNTNGVWGQDSITGLPCSVAPAGSPGGSATCKLPTSASVSGTITANQGAAGASPWPVFRAGATVSGSASSAAPLSNFPVNLATTAPGAQSFVAQWTVAGGGNTAAYTGSNDGVTYFALPCINPIASGVNSNIGASFSINTGNPIYCSTAGYAYIKIAVSIYVSGSPAATVVFSQNPPPTGAVSALITNNGGVPNGVINPGGTAIAPGNSLSVVNEPYVWNGTNADAQVSGPRAAAVGGGTGSASVEEAGKAYANIAGAATTTVKSGKGNLYSITVNTYVASATITIYDNTAGSGTKIGTITLPSTITADAPVTLPYDVAFGTGLTLVTSGATDITVTYR